MQRHFLPDFSLSRNSLLKSVSRCCTDGQLVYGDQPGLKSSAGETFDAIGTEALPVMPQKEGAEAKL